MIASDLDFLLEQNDLKPIRQPEQLISKWIHGRRIMPPGSPIEGVYDINKGPYVIEILDNLSPFNPTRHQALKKGVQIFATTIAENAMAYYIGERPSKIMYISANDTLLKKFGDTRLDPLIDSCDLRDRIFSQTEKLKSRKTGDLSNYKEFIGGTLALVSAQSPANMRSESIKILIRDEIDGAPRMLTTGEGDFLSVSEGRIQAFVENGGKIFDLSTPGLWGESLIDEQYNKGDKRKFFVDCPMCGKAQYLRLGTEKSNYGLKGDYKAGRLQQGYYLCEHCHDAIFDSSKNQLLRSGVWTPTATPINKYFRSYHLPSFYSPGLATFTYIREKYDEAQELGDDGMRSFTNLYLGKSFKPSGERPRHETVIEIRSTYKSGEVPAGIMFLTGAVDVQKGIKKYWEATTEEILEAAEEFEKQGNDKQLKNLPRVEVEIIGHGMNYRTASIIRKLVYGRIDDHTSGAWERLTAWFEETGLVFKRKDGYEFNVKRIFIDSGYGQHMDVVYHYCDQLPMTYAIKGDKPLKQDKMKLSDIDEMKNGNIQRFKYSESGGNAIVLINVNYYKGFIYRNMKNHVDPINGQPPNSHQTPGDYPDYYFDELRAEEQKKDGSFHNIAQRNNEALDLLVYNKCAADFFIFQAIIAEQEVWKKRGIRDKSKLYELVNHKKIMARYEAELRAKGW